jgi:hypothetical protein
MTLEERGQAMLETILLGLLFLIPMIWALGVLADLHSGALAASAAAREAGFDAARATDVTDAERAVENAVEAAFRDQGLDPDKAAVRWSATGDLERGGSVEVSLRYPVTVLQAPLLGRVAGPSIWIRARHVARVDPFRSR